jgi:radical SAM protein with 4Fe4S-binding SPASM domain
MSAVAESLSGNELSLLAINLTRRCNLECDHCYLDAHSLKYGGPHELTTGEVRRLLDDVVLCGEGPMVVLTGGEPLMRRDLEEIIAHGAGLNLAMVVGTNGIMLTERRVRSLQLAGVLGFGISVDSLDPAFHDEFRGRSGAWAKTMAGIEACRRNEVSFQIHFSIFEKNAHELPVMIDFARECGARVLNIFFLVCTGRGDSVTDLTPERYEQILGELIEAQEQCSDLIIRARCAPHFKRVAHQRAPDSALNRIGGQDGDGCIAGTHYCRITPNGGVTACPYIPDEVGNIRHESFKSIWTSSPGLQALRNPVLRGTCGSCEYRKLCGGCRARPLALGGNLMDPDPWCVYEPRGGAVIQPLPDDAYAEISWSTEAGQRLARVPGFLKKIVKKRAEAYVGAQGLSCVTAKHLDELVAKRFGSNGPPRGQAR